MSSLLVRSGDFAGTRLKFCARVTMRDIKLAIKVANNLSLLKEKILVLMINAMFLCCTLLYGPLNSKVCLSRHAKYQRYLFNNKYLYLLTLFSQSLL